MPDTNVRRRISAFILLVAALHVIPVVQETLGSRQTSWPFMAWGMYRYARRPPVETIATRIYVESATGERRLVQPEDVGLESYAFDRLYVTPLAQGDTATARLLTERLDAGARPPDVMAVVFRSIRYRLEASGIAADTTFGRFPIRP